MNINSLLNYVKVATNKRLLISKSSNDSNRCTPYREKLDQHTTCIPNTVRVWSQNIHISHDQRIVIFYEVSNRFVQIHYPREEGLPTQSTARRPSDLWVRTQFLFHNSKWGSGEKTSFCWQSATRLIGPISPTCDRYVQYLQFNHNPSTKSKFQV
jgi:hypothetical protein